MQPIMQPCLIDHIIVTAASLEAGAAFVQQALGVEPQTGGRHSRMGTHNLLLRLGDALFLEVIAIDPTAVHPARPRWFGLDARAANTPPVLSAWVARSTDIRASATQATEPLGNIEPMTRSALEWLITIPADGCVPLDGVAPALIQWQTGQHPAATLPDLGLALAGLEIFHPQPQRVERLLASIGFDGPITVAATPDGAAPRMVAQIDTPDGRRRLPL